MVKVLEFQQQSFQWIFRTYFLQDWLVGPPCSPRDPQEYSPTPRSKALFLLCSAFFMVQVSHPYMTIRKTIALTTSTFFGKVMSVFFNMLSRLVIDFLPRSKHLLISRLQSPSAVIFGAPPPKKKKVSHFLHCFPIYLPWSDGTGCHDLSFLNVQFWMLIILLRGINSDGQPIQVGQWPWNYRQCLRF